MTVRFDHLKNVATCQKVQAYVKNLERLQTDIYGITLSGLLQPDAAAFGALMPPPLNPQGVLQLCILGSPTFQDTPHEESLWDRRVVPAQLVNCEYRHELIEAWASHLFAYESTCQDINATWSIQSCMRGTVADGLRFARDALLLLKEQRIKLKSAKLRRLQPKKIRENLEQAITIVTELDDEDYWRLQWDRHTRPFPQSSFDLWLSQVRRNSNAYKRLLWNMREAFRNYGPGEHGKRYPNQAMYYAMAEVLLHVGVKDRTTAESLARTIQKDFWSLDHPARRVKTVNSPRA